MSSFPSFESMHASVGVDNWGLHGSPTKPSHCFLVFENLNECVGPNIISQRNYPCDRHIKAYFGDVDLITTGKLPFQKQLLQCMLSQALWMKGQIEILRSINSFGSLIWQLNENWPTGGWGAVEYGSYQDEVGQVVGGRWKPLMHLLERFLFAILQCKQALCSVTIGRLKMFDVYCQVNPLKHSPFYRFLVPILLYALMR